MARLLSTLPELSGYRSCNHQLVVEEKGGELENPFQSEIKEEDFLALRTLLLLLLLQSMGLSMKSLIQFVGIEQSAAQWQRKGG